MPPARFFTPKPPCTHPLDRPRRGNCDSPFLEFPPSCSTGNSPAAKAYFVTPPPLGAGDHRSPLRIITTTTEFFGGKAPTAARRARPIQRTYFQGLRGNPDACHPGRGSACSINAKETGGNARPVFALSVQPTAANSPRTGGRRGHTPGPFFSPISLGRNGGPGRAGPRREAEPPPGGRILSAPTGHGRCHPPCRRVPRGSPQ